MIVRVLGPARSDIVAGHHFYEEQEEGLGRYFVKAMFDEIRTLSRFGGVHRKALGFHRSITKRFPYAIYYRLEDGVVLVDAIMDCRRSPAWIRRRLRDL